MAQNNDELNVKSRKFSYVIKGLILKTLTLLKAT